MANSMNEVLTIRLDTGDDLAIRVDDIADYLQRDHGMSGLR